MRAVRWVLLLVALAHGALYAVIMPPWQAPDEVAHFEHSHLMAVLGRPISPADDSVPLEQAIIQSLYQFHAWTYRNGQAPPVVPPQRLDATPFGYSRTLDRFSLTYVIYALAVRPFLNQDIVFQLYVMRFASVIMGALVVVLAFETARLVSPNHAELPVAVAAFVLFLPQHAFITASVSDGNLAELAASACIYLVVVMWVRGLRWPQAALCVACAVAAILSKATAYFLLALLVVVGPALALRWNARHLIGQARTWRNVALASLVVAGLSAVLVPVILWAPPLRFIRTMIGNNAGRLAHFGAYLLTLNSDGRFSNALLGTFDSFWVTFGWMRVSFPPVVYNTLLGLTLLSMVGLVWQLYRLPGKPQQLKSLYLVLALDAVLALAVLIGWFVASPVGVNYYQGRYLFGAIVPIAILLVVGWLAFVPIHYRPQAALLLLVVMVLFDAAAIFNLAWPFFYPAGLI
jgi:hypothetical protein